MYVFKMNEAVAGLHAEKLGRKTLGKGGVGRTSGAASSAGEPGALQACLKSGDVQTEIQGGKVHRPAGGEKSPEQEGAAGPAPGPAAERRMGERD